MPDMENNFALSFLLLPLLLVLAVIEDDEDEATVAPPLPPPPPPLAGWPEVSPFCLPPDDIVLRTNRDPKEACGCGGTLPFRRRNPIGEASVGGSPAESTAGVLEAPAGGRGVPVVRILSRLSDALRRARLDRCFLPNPRSWGALFLDLASALSPLAAPALLCRETTDRKERCLRMRVSTDCVAVAAGCDVVVDDCDMMVDFAPPCCASPSIGLSGAFLAGIGGLSFDSFRLRTGRGAAI
mmetsp:Transcript_27981/g.78429  ORF Transcript_27981/g.78429 Transcript_27981/m.78429 type:complete len:240 (+) Transcript_27981:1353-2072(+)